MNSKFTLALRSGGDIEGWPCIDVFTLKEGEKELLDIHFAFSDEDENQSCKIVSLVDGFEAASLPFIYSPFQLVGIVQDILQNALNDSGHEFYACLFCDEEGNEVELPVDLELYKNR